MHDEDGSATLAPGSAGDGGLTVAQVAQQLGISTDAVRRRLKAGELSGHQRPTKHGPTWCVHPDEPPGLRDGPATVPPTVAPGTRNGSATVAPGSAPMENVDEPPDTGSGMALLQAEAMAAYTRSVLEPLVAALERSEGRVAELERENGRQSAELERAASIAVKLSDELEALKSARASTGGRTAPESPDPATESSAPRWRPRMPWLPAVTMLVVAITLAVLLAVRQ
jgi:hypothetical protein